MVFISWGRPSQQEQKASIDQSGGFNYDSKYRGATAKALCCLREDQELSKEGFLLNHERVLVGSGLETYEKGKTALNTWRHFGLNWAFVDPRTPIQRGTKFCVCVKEFLPWVMLPLQVVYVNESRNKKKSINSFGFGSGTLQGHLLAGEERFSIELDENNQVCSYAPFSGAARTYTIRSVIFDKLILVLDVPYDPPPNLATTVDLELEYGRQSQL